MKVKRYTSFYLKEELCKDLICEGAQIFLKEGIDDDFEAHPEYLKTLFLMKRLIIN